MKILRVDGTTEEIQGEGPNGSVTLKQMQAAVGGPIEPMGPTDRPFLVADEEGMLKDKPLNPKATQIARNHGYNQPIVGDVLIEVRIENVGQEGEAWY